MQVVVKVTFGDCDFLFLLMADGHWPEQSKSLATSWGSIPMCSATADVAAI